MKARYAVISGFLGRVADGFTQYQPHRTLAERFELASQIEGLEGLELVYPSDFEDLSEVKSLLEEHGLGLSAVNLNVKGDPKRIEELRARGSPAETWAYLVELIR